MEISYYAIFNYKDYDKNEKKYGISITFPDVPEANSCARNEKEAVDMALEVLQLSLIGDDGHWLARTALPRHTPIEEIRLHQCEKAVLVKIDTNEVDLSKFKFFE